MFRVAPCRRRYDKLRGIAKLGISHYYPGLLGSRRTGDGHTVSQYPGPLTAYKLLDRLPVVAGAVDVDVHLGVRRVLVPIPAADLAFQSFRCERAQSRGARR